MNVYVYNVFFSRPWCLFAVFQESDFFKKTYSAKFLGLLLFSLDIKVAVKIVGIQLTFGMER